LHPRTSPISQLLPLIRDRLDKIAVQAATAAEALDDADCIDLDSRQLADLMWELDSLAARVSAIVERLSGAMDPARLCR
jgi:hypothetical protein